MVCQPLRGGSRIAGKARPLRNTQNNRLSPMIPTGTARCIGPTLNYKRELTDIHRLFADGSDDAPRAESLKDGGGSYPSLSGPEIVDPERCHGPHRPRNVGGTPGKRPLSPWQGEAAYLRDVVGTAPGEPRGGAPAGRTYRFPDDMAPQGRGARSRFPGPSERRCARARESRHSGQVIPLLRYGPARSSTSAGNADRAVPV